LIKFKAGKLEHKRKEDSDAFIVTPVKKKGEILLQKGDDQLIHFQWRDRESGLKNSSLQQPGQFLPLALARVHLLRNLISSLLVLVVQHTRITQWVV
jgi:hypothetical protein